LRAPAVQAYLRRPFDRRPRPVRVLPVVIVIVPSGAQIGIGMLPIMRVGGRDGIGQLTDSGG